MFVDRPEPSPVEIACWHFDGCCGGQAEAIATYVGHRRVDLASRLELLGVRQPGFEKNFTNELADSINGEEGTTSYTHPGIDASAILREFYRVEVTGP